MDKSSFLVSPSQQISDVHPRCLDAWEKQPVRPKSAEGRMCSFKVTVFRLRFVWVVVMIALGLFSMGEVRSVSFILSGGLKRARGGWTHLSEKIIFKMNTYEVKLGGRFDSVTSNEAYVSSLKRGLKHTRVISTLSANSEIQPCRPH